MRCLIIGSSKSMPSLELKYENTWVYRLIKIFLDIEFIDKNHRSSSARRLVTEGALAKGYDLLEFYNPDCVITHFGITDSYPRLLKREAIITRFINHLPRPISNLIYDIVRKTKGRTISCCDISPQQFKDCFGQYCNRAKKQGVHVFIVKIAYCNDKVIQKSPHVIEAINLYNAQLDEVANMFNNVSTITPLPADADLNSPIFLQTDGIHLTAKGSEIVFNNIKNAILNIYPQLYETANQKNH